MVTKHELSLDLDLEFWMERVHCQWLSDPRFNEDQRTQCSIIQISFSWCKLSTSTSTVSTHAQHLTSMQWIKFHRLEGSKVKVMSSYCTGWKFLCKDLRRAWLSRDRGETLCFTTAQLEVLSAHYWPVRKRWLSIRPPAPAPAALLHCKTHFINCTEMWNMMLLLLHSAAAAAPRTAASLNIYNDKM